MSKTKKLTASQEDYLEAIYIISQEKKAARAKDIASLIGVRASSVTSALRTLGNLGLINYAPYDLITLTEKGEKAARGIVGKHNALKKFLTDVLGVESSEAEDAACRMEHSVPGGIVERLVKYAEYVEHCPKGGITWESGFGFYCREGCAEDSCDRPGQQRIKRIKNDGA